ncbi:MarR family winged helix-turn-helix transcriptional regulator [Nonomuraea angiospora]|uniref:DNA-binding MarR family transcriptional regulator n=1 Tax=Nonomuraea angiospora TaxID=46172 RepID=A0ABR9M690_9ACTN|nr:MarR family transcriptional regulator [Nonomuraea angiospora]MBE1588042.1 DNA-binding MarR family transcriptional regulator [Nonomuraea angiospora]
MLTNTQPKTDLRSDAGLASALRVSMARLTRRLRRQAAAHSLTPTQFATLAAIERRSSRRESEGRANEERSGRDSQTARHSGITPGELAELEKVQPPSMTRVIAALEERGLVSRSPHPTDRRQVTVTITEAAEKLLKEERRRKEAWLTQRLKELSPEERAVLRQAAPILEKLSRI